MATTRLQFAKAVAVIGAVWGTIEVAQSARDAPGLIFENGWIIPLALVLLACFLWVRETEKDNKVLRRRVAALESNAATEKVRSALREILTALDAIVIPPVLDNRAVREEVVNSIRREQVRAIKVFRRAQEDGLIDKSLPLSPSLIEAVVRNCLPQSE